MSARDSHRINEEGILISFQLTVSRRPIDYACTPDIKGRLIPAWSDISVATKLTLPSTLTTHLLQL